MEITEDTEIDSAEKMRRLLTGALHCPISECSECGSKRISTVFGFKDGTFYQCNYCGHLMEDNQTAPDAINAIEAGK